jgi:hypothetical protein
MFTAIILAASLASAQDCEPVSAERISSMMQQALLDFATLDEDSFYRTTEQAAESLPCLDEVLLAPNAAAYHRLMGLKAFFDGQDEVAVISFRASQHIEPDYVLSSKIAPEGGKLHRLWAQAEAGPSPFIGSFTTPGGMYAWVDGAEGTLQAEDLPSIVQYGIGEDEVAWTAYLLPGEQPPSTMPGVGLTVVQPRPQASPVAPAPEPVPASASGLTSRRDLAEAQAPEKTKGNGRGGLIAATVISGAMAGGLYGGATYMRTEYDRAPTRENYLMTNGAFYGAIGMGAATVTFGSLAAFTKSR